MIIDKKFHNCYTSTLKTNWVHEHPNRSAHPLCYTNILTLSYTTVMVSLQNWISLTISPSFWIIKSTLSLVSLHLLNDAVSYFNCHLNRSTESVIIFCKEDHARQARAQKLAFQSKPSMHITNTGPSIVHHH